MKKTKTKLKPQKIKTKKIHRHAKNYYGDDEFKEEMKNKSDDFVDEREKMLYYKTLERWENNNQRNPFDIAIDFIKQKGLKIYGGLALNEYIKQFEDPFYGDEEFPDYDVFSPNAWDHAKQLAKLLYDSGFKYVEARSSILNDETHQTYKVSADFDYIMDVTQVGCLPKNLKENDCNDCAIKSISGDCLDLFNNVPANDREEINKYNTIEEDTIKLYREIYDFNNDASLYPDKVFITAPEFLKVSAYRELTEPTTHPERLAKVSTRTRKLDRYYEWSERRCDLNEYNKAVDKHLLPILEHVGNFCKKHKLVHYGATAHNIFVKNNKYYDSKHYGSLVVSDYNVYSKNAKEDSELLLEELKEKYPDFYFSIQEKQEYWKETDSHSFSINLSKEETPLKYDNIIVLTKPVTCIPYIQYNGVRYVSVDRLKYIYYRSAVIPSIMEYVEQDKKNYGCLLSHLLSSEKAYKKTKSKNKTKFRRYIGKCYGEEVNKMRKNLLKRWNQRHEREKDSKVKFNHPTKGYATRVYPMPEKKVNLPFRPMDDEFKKNEERKQIENKNEEPYSTYRRFWDG